MRKFVIKGNICYSKSINELCIYNSFGTCSRFTLPEAGDFEVFGGMPEYSVSIKTT